jgi:hypothetical protein
MGTLQEASFTNLGNSLRFQDWYSALAPVFYNISTNACNQTLTSYLNEPWDDLRCDAHLDCMLENTAESLKAKIASAAVFLGVLPSLLSLFGPSLAHLTLLSARRPFLAFCIACGNPGFYAGRLFTVETPAEAFEEYGGSRFIPRVKSLGWMIFISAVEYILAGAAIFNVVTISLRIGDRVIMSFECRIWFLPIIWMGMFVVIFLIVAIPFQFSRTARHMRGSDSRWTDKGRRQLVEDEGGIRWVGDGNTWETEKQSNIFRQYLMRELTPGARQASLDARRIPEFERWMASSLNFGYLLVAFHIILGTCWFSSTLFLSPKDAITIIMRYFGSSVACRLIIAVELAGLKARGEKVLSK